MELHFVVVKNVILFLSEPLAYITQNANQVDLVITDMTMPQLTGVALSRKLLETIPDLPIIITTGFSEDISPEIADSIGLGGYLMKPIEIKALAKIVRKVLDKKATDIKRQAF